MARNKANVSYSNLIFHYLSIIFFYLTDSPSLICFCDRWDSHLRSTGFFTWEICLTRLHLKSFTISLESMELLGRSGSKFSNNKYWEWVAQRRGGWEGESVLLNSFSRQHLVRIAALTFKSHYYSWCPIWKFNFCML